MPPSSGNDDKDITAPFNEVTLPTVSPAKKSSMTGAPFNPYEFTAQEVDTFVDQAMTGDAEAVGLTLKRRHILLNQKESELGMTALMMAAAFNQIECIKVLVNAGAFLDAKDGEGLTALDWAKRRNHKEAADLISDEREKAIRAVAAATPPPKP